MFFIAHHVSAERSRIAKKNLRGQRSAIKLIERMGMLSPQFEWNSRGLLERIGIFPDAPSRTPEKTPTYPQQEFRFSAPEETSRVLSDRVELFAKTGAPIGEVPWWILDIAEWTPFQRAVYRAISEIPHGETRSYGWVARKIGNPKLARAVGQALSRNPLPLLIPCHRVVGAGGELCGFMGEDSPESVEISLKQHLLELETSYLNPSFGFI